MLAALVLLALVVGFLCWGAGGPGGASSTRPAACLAVLVFAGPAMAQAPEGKNAGPATVSVQAGGLVTMSGDADTAITPTAFIDVDGPIVVGNRSRARGYARIGITALPGEQIDPADVSTFRAATVGIGLGVVVGRSQMGGQELLSSVVAEAGFASRLRTAEAVPVDRLARHYGLGIRLQERSSGIAFTALFGRDEACGDRGFGQVLLHGAVPITGADVGGRRANVVLVGSASLALGPAAATWLQQRDVFRLGVVIAVEPRR